MKNLTLKVWKTRKFLSNFDGKIYDLRLYDGVAKYRGHLIVKPYSERYFERLIYENNFQSNITGWVDSGASLSHDSTNEEMRQQTVVVIIHTQQNFTTY